MPFRSQSEALHQRERQLVAELEALDKQAADLKKELMQARATLAEPGNQPALDDIAVASPCREAWDSMKGDERVRHCDKCDKNVFNLEALTRREAHQLLAEHSEPCVRLRRRKDGTVITGDCPEGQRIRRRRRLVAAGVLLTAGGWLAMAQSLTVMGGMAPHGFSPGYRAAVSPAHAGGAGVPAELDPAALSRMQSAFGGATAERVTLGSVRPPDDFTPLPSQARAATHEDRELARAALDALIERIPALGPAPVSVDRKANAIALRLHEANRGTVLHGLGLRKGDRLLALNGHGLDDPQHALQAYGSVKAATRLVLEIERAGKPMFLTYTVK